MHDYNGSITTQQTLQNHTTLLTIILIMGLTTEQTAIIKATIPVLQEHGLTITTHFYQTLLAEIPALNSVFNQAHQATGHQARALAGALVAYASNIDKLAALAPFLERVCNKHVSLFVRPEQYAVVGTYLLRSLSAVLGDACTPPILDAWGAAYQQLADIMIEKEKGMYAAQAGWTDWRPLEVVAKRPESSDITSFYLKPRDGKPLPSHRPGQYISVSSMVPALGHSQARQYSLSEAPDAGHYRISVKRDTGAAGRAPGRRCPYSLGAVSNALHDDVRVGDTLYASHPAGDFFLASPSSCPFGATKSSAAETSSAPTSGPVVLLSAGVGLTPLLSMLNTLTSSSPTTTPRQVSWIHGARDSSAHAFASHVRKLAASRPQHFRATVFSSQPTEGDLEGVHYQHAGRVDLGKLDAEQDLFLGDARAEYYVCGPEGFMADVERGLRNTGVEAGRIRMEVFSTGGVSRED